MNKGLEKEEPIIDTDYENHFTKDFFGQSVNTEKIKSETFFDNLEENLASFGKNINKTINAISETVQGYQLKQKLNFTILDIQEINALTKTHKSFANQLAGSIGLIIAAIGIIFLLLISPIYLLLSIIILIASITTLVTSSIKFHNQTKSLFGKNIQLEIKNYNQIKQAQMKHEKKLASTITFLMLSIFIPIIIIVAIAIFAPMSYLDFIMPLWLTSFFVSIGLGVFKTVHYGILRNYYSKIVNGNPF